MAGKKNGRPEKIDLQQLKAIMRLKPSLDDCAAFFECHISTIENTIKRHFKMGFSEFREQNMVHTRFMLIRGALGKAQKGDNTMLIFCLKNLCGWKDRYDLDGPTTAPQRQVTVVYNPTDAKKDVDQAAKRLTPLSG